MHIPCLHCESSLWVWGQDSAFEETGWLMWGWLGVAVICKVPGPAAAFSGLCLLTRVSPPCSPPRGHPLPVFTEPTRGLGERGSPPWLESHTHPFLMCHQPQRAHSAARAGPGARSPAWSRPDQKGDSQVFNQPGTWELKGTRSHLGLCQDPF